MKTRQKDRASLLRFLDWAEQNDIEVPITYLERYRQALPELRKWALFERKDKVIESLGLLEHSSKRIPNLRF
jgi:hypothetical protein